MASYSKTFYAVNSENTTNYIFTGTSIHDRFRPNIHEATLYVSYQPYKATDGYVYISANSPSIYFNYDIPSGKKITSVKVFIRARRSYSKNVYMDNIGPVSVNAGWCEFDAGYLYSYYTIHQVDSDDYGYAEFYSHSTAYSPYAVVTYEDAPPKQPSSLFPSKTNIDARMPIKFTWKYESDDNQTQTKYEIQYSIDNKVSWTTVVGSTSNKFHDFPPDTFPTTGTIHWRVRTTDGNGLVSPWAETYFNTAIIPQKAPLVISPTTGYLDGSEEIEFSWRFIGGADYDVQSKFDLDYSSNEGETWTTITQETNSQNYIAPPNTFPSGSYAWRVRTYNAFNEVSPYSEIAKFNIISEPPIPQIQSVTNASRPLVAWISSEQQSYELQIIQNGNIVVGTGVVPSLSKEHKLSQYLQDGEYIARLRVTNQYNLTSPWAEYSFNINTSSNKPPKPQITIYNEEYGVTIKVIGSSNTNLVYRDGKEIGVMDGQTFTDYTGKNNVLHRYFVRSINAQDNFSDSDIKLGKCSFRYNTLATASNPKDYLVLKYGLNSIPKKTGETRSLGEIQHFDGRTYPTIEYSEFKTLSKTVSFILKSKEELEKLEFLINKNEPLLYRNNDNENIYGVVLSVAHEETMFGYVIDISITKVGDMHD